MKCLRILILLLLPFSLSGCAAAIIAGVAGGALAANTGFGQTVIDKMTTASVQSKLAEDYMLKSLDIDVSTHEGIVTLRGQVQTQQESDRAALVTSGVDDVKNVVNALTVTGKQVAQRATGGRDCDDKPTKAAAGLARVSGNRLSVRSGPSTDCSVLRSLSGSDRFTLSGEAKGWYYIELDNGRSGWVSGKYVIKTDAAEAIPAPALPADSKAKAAPPADTKAKSDAPNATVAVISFSDSSPDASKDGLGALVAEKITTSIVRYNAFRPIERKQLSSVVNELELSQSGIMDTSRAVEIGRLSNSDLIVVGSVAVMNQQVSIDARLISVQNGAILSAASRTARYNLENLNSVCRTVTQELTRQYYGRRT